MNLVPVFSEPFQVNAIQVTLVKSRLSRGRNYSSQEDPWMQETLGTIPVLIKYTGKISKINSQNKRKFMKNYNIIFRRN